MRYLLLLATLVSVPATAEVALFSQRDFQGARYSLEAASSNMSFSPRSVRIADKPWELCPRPFYGGTCLTIDSTRPNLSLPRAFSGMVRSARPLKDVKKKAEKPEEKADEKPLEKPQPKD